MTDCNIRYTIGGTSVPNRYGNSPDTDNIVVLDYRDLNGGTAWGSGDKLSSIIFQPKAGLTGQSGVIFPSSGSNSITWYIEVTCNGCTIRWPATGNHTDTYNNYAGSGKAYNGFTNWKYVPIPVSMDAVNNGDIAVISGKIGYFLTGVKDYAQITTKYYFPNNSNYRIINNANAEIRGWEANIAPSTPVLQYPAIRFASLVTYNLNPRISMSCTDADNDTLTYLYHAWTPTLTWKELGTNVPSGTTVTGQINTDFNSADQWYSTTLHVRAVDSKGFSSTVLGFQIEIKETSIDQDQTISEGSIINNSTINNIQSDINKLKVYYGDGTAPTWTSINAGSKMTATSIKELNDKLKALPPGQSFAVPKAGDKITLATLQAINTAIKNS